MMDDPITRGAEPKAPTPRGKRRPGVALRLSLDRTAKEWVRRKLCGDALGRLVERYPKRHPMCRKTIAKAAWVSSRHPRWGGLSAFDQPSGACIVFSRQFHRVLAFELDREGWLFPIVTFCKRRESPLPGGSETRALKAGRKTKMPSSLALLIAIDKNPQVDQKKGVFLGRRLHALCVRHDAERH